MFKNATCTSLARNVFSPGTCYIRNTSSAGYLSPGELKIHQIQARTLKLMKIGSFGLDSISNKDNFHQIEHEPPITGMFIFHTTGPKLNIRYTIFEFYLGLRDLKYNRSPATIL